MTKGRWRTANRAIWRAFATLLLLAWAGPASRATEPYREEAVKAAFLHRFTALVDWPAAALRGGTFRIVVLGAPEVLEELKRLLADRQIKGLPIELASDAAKSAAVKPQLLYVGRGYPGDLRRLLAGQRGRPVLIVTDQPRGLEEGGVINFLLVDRRVRFEVSPAPAQQSGMHISSQLLGVAVRVLGSRTEAAP